MTKEDFITPELQIAFQAAKEYYGTGLVQCFNLNHAFSGLVIWFPKITVTNDEGSKLFLKDLLIKIPIDFEGKIGVIQGMDLRRTHLNKYYACCHPHRKRESLGTYFYEFCLGESMVSTLKAESAGGDFTKDEWFLFFQNFDDYIRQEGDPYIKISQIYAKSGKISSNPSIEKDLIHKTLTYLINDKGLKYLRTNIIINYFNDNEFTVDFTEQLLDDISHYIITTNNHLEILNNYNIIGVFNTNVGFGIPTISNKFKDDEEIITRNSTYKWKKSRDLKLKVVPNETFLNQEEKDYFRSLQQDVTLKSLYITKHFVDEIKKSIIKGFLGSIINDIKNQKTNNLNNYIQCKLQQVQTLQHT